jgi:ATP-dependent RNA helicase MSS116
MNPKVKQVANFCLGSGHKSISTVKEIDSSTLPYVKQQYMIMDTEWHLPFLAKMISESTHVTPNAKIICFFTTARTTALAAAAVSF